MADIASRDQNSVPTLLAASSSDGTPVTLFADPSTHRLLVSSAGGTASTITVQNEAVDTTCFPIFVTAATGDLGPKSNAGLTFNSNTAALGALLLMAGDGLVGAPSISFTADPTTGFYRTASGVTRYTSAGTSSIILQANGVMNLLGANATVFFGTGSDALVRRVASRSLAVGMSSNSSPTLNTLTIGEDSRSGTDSNVAGSNGVLRSGAGTGNSTGSSLVFQTPSATTSGTGAQSLAARITVNETASTFVGNVSLSVAGNGLLVKEGSNATMGVATLSGGLVGVATTKVTANSRIFVTVQSLGTVTVPKAVAVTSRIAGSIFTITSADATDTSTVAWMIVEPA